MTDNRVRKRGVSTPPYLCPDGSEPCGRYGYCGHCPHDKSKRMRAMTDKPEVVTFHCYGQSAPAYSCNKPSDNSGEYVRLSDHERLQADYERLQAELELWKAKIYAMAEHEVAAYQLIGIPASVGISEPVEGFARRPQDIMPAVRDMALRIELLEHQAAERERLIAESRANDQQAMAYLSEVREIVGGDDFPDMVRRCAQLRAAIRRLCNIYAVDDYYDGQLREERLEAAVNRAINAVMEPPK